MDDVAVVGGATTRFGRFRDHGYVHHGAETVRAALADAGLAWGEVDEAACGACGVGPFAGNRIGQLLGCTDVRITNIDNASASGSVAFRDAYLAVAEGRAEVAVAFGVGQMGGRLPDAAGGDPDEAASQAATGLGNPATIFGLLAARRMHEFGTVPATFAAVVAKNRRHAVHNEFAQLRTPISVPEVLASPMLADPLHVADACPMGDGATAVVLTSARRARSLGSTLVTVDAAVMVGEHHDDVPFPGVPLTGRAAALAYEQAGCGPDDLDLIEVHDAFSNEELEYYEALGLCPPGEADRMLLSGETTIGGRIPCNTDGGLLSRGHPLGPTGLAQVVEILSQLRGRAGARQVEDARVGLAHMVGAGTVAVVHILRRR